MQKNSDWLQHLVADIAIVEIYPSSDNIGNRIKNYSFPIQQIFNEKQLPSREADLTFLGFPIIDLELEHFFTINF